jgi:hypothetical protein
MIPALRASFSGAVNHINDTVSGLHRAGYLTGPWLGDETSQEIATYYTRRAMDAPDSSYQSLVAYRDELARIHDTLQEMEDHYRRTEGDNTALWGRKA